MFNDYITMMLINMVAGLVVLGTFVIWGLAAENKKPWVPAFAIAGLVALVSGLHMTFTWPVPHPQPGGAYNIAYGEMSVFLGVLFLAAALAISREWDLSIMTLYAFFAGVAAVVIGVQFIRLGATRTPWLAGAGFILTGLGGVLSGLVWSMRTNEAVRWLGGFVLFAAAGIWAYIGYGAYWAHMANYLPKPT